MDPDEAVPRAPAFFELGAEALDPERLTGQHSWYVRARSVVAVVSWAAEGEVLREPAGPDEQAVVVPDDGSVEVVHENGRRVAATGPATVVAPAGAVEVIVRRAGLVLRVFSARSGIGAEAVNASAYPADGEPVAPQAAGPGTLRVYPVDPRDAGAGRVHRTGSFTVEWAAPQDGPEPTDELRPRVCDGEQMSITLAGDHVHHVRRPWTGRLRDWRRDEHVQVSSPSVTLVAPGDPHVTRAVGPGPHQRIEVLAVGAQHDARHHSRTTTPVPAQGRDQR